MKLLDTLLVIGGPDSDRPLLRKIFENDYNLLEADSAEQGLFLMERNRSCIVAVIVDAPPPENIEEAFLSRVRARDILGDIPVLVIIPLKGTGDLEELAFSIGAADVVRRPYSPAIVRHRVQVMVDLLRSRRRMQSILERQAETIRHTNEVMVDALSSIIEYRSAESGGHILRIRRFTEILLKEVARSFPEYELTQERIANISSAAALHDIGKISIPDYILDKPDKLTPQEMEAMKAHTVNGAQMVESLGGITGEEYLRYAYNICRSHHERWDGSGYPDGLVGEKIPICAQAVGLADAFDALTASRRYKGAIPGNAAVNMILNGECGAFSPKLLVCLKAVARSFMDLAKEYADGRSPREDNIALPLPEPTLPDQEISSLELSQLKYQAMLHYARATVVEIDINYGTFHEVYNPFPNFRPVSYAGAEGYGLKISALNQIHPDDLDEAAKEYHFLMSGFFDQGLRSHSFSHRIYSSTLGDYRMYEVTFLRLNVADREQRKALLIWRPTTPLPIVINERGEDVVQANKAMLIMMSSIICRRNDNWYTMMAGQGNLLDLLGYTRAEVRDLFQDRFVEMILPEDRENMRRQAEEGLKTGNRVELEYRMRRKDGRILWILEKGCLVVDDKGVEYFYGALTDNSRSHADRAELEGLIERSKIIIEQGDNVVVNWDLSSNELEVSSNWSAIFGYEPERDRMNLNRLNVSRIHPDDWSLLRKTAGKIRQGQLRQEVELRLVNGEGRYLWCRLRMTGITNGRGETSHVVGTLTNIDRAKRSYMLLQEQAQKDSLTNLLNKEATQAAIRGYLDTQGESCALMMIDLDNFKGINDRFGHLFGDTVLTRTANTIHRLFRGGDIIGRVGGDEFMVLMKNVGEEELVSERCQLLLKELSGLFSRETDEFQVTCSVGVAMSPEHGRSFQELFQHADQALYKAKQSGKHCFEIYREDLNLSVQQFSTTIDSNTQPGLASSNLVRAVFHQLAHSKDMEKTIHDVLALVGQRTNVSRVYVFENNDENTHCSNTFEWCNEGIPPEIHNLQNISYETDLPGWEENYDENGILFCTDINQLAPRARAILEPQGVKSMLHCAIRENGVFRGYIGLDECESNRVWAKEQVDILIFLSEVVASFLLKKRAQDRHAAMSANLNSILESQRNWMYVIDPESYCVRYFNEKTGKAIPTLRVGDVCYRAIRGQDAPCANCPIGKIGGNGYATSRIFSPALGVDVISEADSIQWDHSPACLITCRSLDDE